MARKPNYKFERSERDRAKAAKKAERMKKRERRDEPGDEPGAGEAPAGEGGAGFDDQAAADGEPATNED